jgi:hopene-associated glycosyltransferase HpnB
VAVVPARNERDVVGRALASLLAQDYAGPFRIVLVDDGSDDGTAEAARALGSDRLAVAAAPPLLPGWTGKLAAMAHGLAEAHRTAPHAAYVLLTDADIEHDPGNLADLVARAEGDGIDLVSLMARLPCRTWPERFLMPAYVFYFQMLYPFAWVRSRRRRTAAAAGGCMLVRRLALERMGGLAAIRDEVIDDCALARAIKTDGGRIWLGLAERARSLRGYRRPLDVWRLIARSAYAQLRHSPALLVLTVAGMGIVFVAPPLLALAGSGPAAFLGLVCWASMTVAYAPTLRTCGAPVLAAPLLPLVALFYVGATLDSARAYIQGRGGAWKGRFQARRP